MGCDFDKNKAIKLLISQAKTLEKNVNRSLNDTGTAAPSRYVNFKLYAQMYNKIACESEKILGLPQNSFSAFRTNDMKDYMDTLWGTQKQVMEAVALQVGMLLTYLESATDFVEDEFESLSNFIRSKLRASIFSVPSKEIEVQNTIESLLIGRDMAKGIDYDRET